MYARKRASRGKVKGWRGTFVDVQLPKLESEPIATVRAIYRAMGCELTPAMEQKLRVWLAENKENVTQTETSCLAEDFGLPASVDAMNGGVYRKYCEAFGVECA